MNNEINPVSYGKLISKVDNLEKQVDALEKDIKTLLELANQSKGGMWAGMMIVSALGGFVGYITHLFVGR